MDKITAVMAPADAPAEVEDFEFEIEDVSEIDIFAPTVSLCSSTTSSSTCCG